MERSELKKLLKEMGVKPELTEMPAVVEPLLNKFNDLSCSSEFSEGLQINEIARKITVKPDGTFSFGKGTVSASGENFIIPRNFDLNEPKHTIIINKYGIEIDYCDGYHDNFTTSSRTEDGVIETINNDFSNSSCIKHFDNGSWSIFNAKGKIFSDKPSRSSNPITTSYLPSDKQLILEEFDKNSEEVTKNYPATTPWYEEKRKELVSALGLQQQNHTQKQALSPKQTDYSLEQLKQDNLELRKSVETLEKTTLRLTQMLSAVLNSLQAPEKYTLNEISEKEDLTR